MLTITLPDFVALLIRSFSVLIEPSPERRQDWQAMLLAQCKGVVSAAAPFRQGPLGQCLNLIQADDQVQRLARAPIGLPLRLGRFIKVTPRVGEASKMTHAIERTPGAVAVGHQRSRIAAQECLRMLLATPGLVLEQHRRRGVRFGAALGSRTRLPAPGPLT